jgi:hypothetical protein
MSKSDLKRLGYGSTNILDWLLTHNLKFGKFLLDNELILAVGDVSEIRESEFYYFASKVTL